MTAFEDAFLAEMSKPVPATPYYNLILVPASLFGLDPVRRPQPRRRTDPFRRLVPASVPRRP